MWLPPVNSLTGKPVYCDLNKAMNESYAKYSEAYWAGVALRAKKYRAATVSPIFSLTDTPPVVTGVINRLAHSDSLRRLSQGR